MITEEKINLKKEAKVANVNEYVQYEDNFILEDTDLHKKYLADSDHLNDCMIIFTTVTYTLARHLQIHIRDHQVAKSTNDQKTGQ